jgi:tetratricopeptide (TPR) repeat protein
MKTLGLVSCVFVIFSAACGPGGERRIQLGKRPVEAISRDRVRTVQIAADEKKKVAILHLRNETNQTDLNWLSQGLAEMLAFDLGQSRQLNLMPNRNISEVLSRQNLTSDEVKTSPFCQKVAGDLGTAVLITGRYYFQQDSLRVDVVLWDGTSGEIILTLSGGSPDVNLKDMFKMIHPLAGQIRARVEEKASEPSEPFHNLADATTNSLEAYKKYTEGINLMDAMLIPAAIESFKQAVAKDSTFASAYLQLSLSYFMVDDAAAARPLLRKALAYSEKLPERERLPILAMNARADGDYERAVRLYNQNVAIYPEDDMGHFQLGDYYFSVATDYHKAIENFEAAVTLNPEHKSAYNMLAYSYAYVGEMDHAYDALDKYVELAKDEPNPYDSYGEILQRAGRIKEAVEKYKTALRKNSHFYPAKYHLAAAYLDLGKVSRARKILKNIQKKSTDPYEKKMSLPMLALTEVVAGNIDRAEDYVNQAEESAQDDFKLIDVLLALAPDSEVYRNRFLKLVENEKNRMKDQDYPSDRIFYLVATALEYHVGVAEVRELLNSLMESKSSPVSYHIALAYAMVFNFYDAGQSSSLQTRLERSIAPQTFQLTSPPSWNHYWKYYFAGLLQADKRGMNIAEWANGLHQFAEISGNPYIKTEGVLALAAAKYAAGDSVAAKTILANTGIPCEDYWTVIGPFDVRKGFNQFFWPEERGIGEWWNTAQRDPLRLGGHDGQLDGYVNLKEIARTRYNQAVYAVLPINSPAIKKAQLHLGMNGRLKVWLNDELAMVINQRSAAVIDRFDTPVRLRPGVNWLMVRLDNPIGELGFYFRLTDAFGNPDPEISFGEPAAPTNNHPN